MVMEFWLTDLDGKRLAPLIVGPESLQVLADDDLYHRATAWLVRQRASDLWRGCDSMGTFLYEFSVSAQNRCLPVQVRLG